jgi:cobalt-zinc-cadmium efflux system membrane fusion protein
MFRVVCSWLTNVAVLGSLAGIAWWGHHTDWTFVHVAHHAPAEGESQHHDLHPSRDTHVASTPANVVKLDRPDTAGLVGISTGEVLARPLAEELEVHGQVAYVQSRLAQLSARVPGIVWRVDKQAGDVVEEGEVLAILDASDVGKAKAEFLQALVQAELRQRNLKRIEDAPDSVPERVRREAEAAYREACVQRYNAQQSLINLGLPVKIETLTKLSDDERAARIRFLGLPEAFTRDHDPETTTANLIPLKAPFDGVIIRRDITPGEVVTPEQAQLTIADVRTMWLELDVHKEDSMRVRVGQPVTFEADGLPGPLTSKVAWISTEADSRTRTVRVIAEVENPVVEAQNLGKGTVPGRKRLLEANVFGNGRIRLRDTPMALMVPKSAVVWSGEAHVVFVPVEKVDETPVEAVLQRERRMEFEPRQIEIGVASDDGYVEVLTGLVAEQRVVISGAHVLHSEMKLREMTSGAEVAKTAQQ